MISDISDFLAYIQQGMDTLGLTPIVQGAMVIIGVAAVAKWIMDHRG